MKKNNLKNLFIDLVLLGVIVSVGWFLIGYYLQGEYLSTSYQDWIYHAWRVKTLSLYGGMPSWDHIWSNGLNHWVAYQYMQHWAILFIVKIFHMTITKAMLLATVVVFILLRVLMYTVLRLLKVKAIVAFLAVILSFVFDQQWIAIGDFSIFMAMIIIPFYVYLWINVFQKYEKLNIPLKKRYLAEGGLAVFSGALWILHPVVANALGGLFFISIGFRALKIYGWYFVGIFMAYLLGASPFLLPYLTASAHYSNPIFSSTIFLNDTITGNFFGLSMYFVAFMGVAWLLFIVFANKITSWAKVIIIYTSLYFLIIFLGKFGYVPSFILQLQISRVVPILAILLSFSFAGILNSVIQYNKKISKGFVTIILIISAIGIAEAISIATTFTGQPVKTMDSPVAIYFNNKPTPQGSIYVKNVSAASFFGKSGLRFVNSYNEHLLPQPLSMRYSSLLRSEIAYTSIPKSQVKLIKDYSLVLGVEYLVLPNTSPLIKYLTENDDRYLATFNLAGIVNTKKGQFTILRNKEKINYAYLVDKNDSILKWRNKMPKITLQMNSYVPWDNIIENMAQQIRENKITPIDKFSFVDTNKLELELDKSVNLHNKTIIIMQSYNNNWRVSGKKVIKPSQARFIVIDPNYLLSKKLIKRKNGQTQIILENNWPIWHWPVQLFGILMIGMIFVLSAIRPKLFFAEIIK